MNKIFTLIIMISLLGCQAKKKENIEDNKPSPTADFTLSFGSCNNQALPNNLWRQIVKNKPNVWVWGGDVIYCDTQDMAFMKKNYNKQKNDTAYQTF